MARAYKCDKCGDVETGAPALAYEIQMARITIEALEGYNPDFDLCHDCAREYVDQFAEFMGHE